MRKLLLSMFALASLAGLKAQTPGDIIDLGLSVKWHSCNYGATSTSDTGKLYAFADLKDGGYTSQLAYPLYSRDTFKYIFPTDGIAGTDKDAAFVGSNGACRMPTNEEWQELFTNCTVEEATVNNVNGCMLTSRKNGNSIFMPQVTILYRFDEVTGVRYYASTPESQNLAMTVNEVVGSSPAKMTLSSFSEPYIGLPIRPVVEADIPELTGIVINTEKNELFAGTKLQLDAAPIPEDSKISKAVWSSSDPSVATVSDSGLVTGLASGSVTITVEANGILQSVVLNVVKVDTPITEEYVDLGLSVKWSAWNLGATAYGQTGTAYPWGYLTPDKIESHLQYKFFNQMSFQYRLPKKDIGGDISYDAVAASTEGKAKLASIDQFNELLASCDYASHSVDGVDGLLFTSRINGKSIFLPFSGTQNIYYSGSANDGLSWVHVIRYDGQGHPEATSCSMPYRQYYLRGVMPIENVKLESLKLNKTEVDLYTLNTFELTAIPEPISYDIDSVTWTSSNSDIALVTSDGLVIAKSPGQTIITATVDGISVTCTVYVSDVSVTPGDFIDMGTGVLWTTRNLGAKEPYDVGTRYAFGAVTPSTTPTNYPDDIRGTAYDVVHATMGGNWYMPTPQDYKALIDNTTMEWINWESTAGALLTSKVNGNKLFIPMNNYGQIYYHTSLLDAQRSDISQAYHATDRGQELGGLSTSVQLPVRGVCTDLTVGVDSIEVERGGDIYTLSGILIKRNASPAEIKSLPAGLYIVAGKKLIKK